MYLCVVMSIGKRYRMHHLLFVIAWFDAKDAFWKSFKNSISYKSFIEYLEKYFTNYPESLGM